MAFPPTFNKFDLLKITNRMKNDDLSITVKIKFIQDTIYTISGKWKLPILMAIYSGANKFRDIQRSVGRIITRVLSKELKELETHLLIKREVDDTYPRTITYNVTEYAFTLKPLVDEMIDWGRNHRGTVAGK